MATDPKRDVFPESTSRCQCEHGDHFAQAIGGGAVLMPHGHTHGEIVAGVRDVETARGRRTLCRPCRDAGHMTRRMDS
jgi:hypothetical protein